MSAIAFILSNVITVSYLDMYPPNALTRPINLHAFTAWENTNQVNAKISITILNIVVLNVYLLNIMVMLKTLRPIIQLHLNVLYWSENISDLPT